MIWLMSWHHMLFWNCGLMLLHFCAFSQRLYNIWDPLCKAKGCGLTCPASHVREDYSWFLVTLFSSKKFHHGDKQRSALTIQYRRLPQGDKTAAARVMHAVTMTAGPQSQKPPITTPDTKQARSVLVKTHARTEGEAAKSPNKERAQGRQNSWDYNCYNADSQYKQGY